MAAAKEAHDAKMQAFIEGKREEMEVFSREVENHAKAAEKAEEEDRRDRMKAFVQSKQDAVDAILDKAKAMADAAKQVEEEKREEEKFAQAGRALGGAFASALAGEVQKPGIGRRDGHRRHLLSILAAILPAAGMRWLGFIAPGVGTSCWRQMGHSGAGAALQGGPARGTKRSGTWWLG